MRNNYIKTIEWALRITLSAGFLSAVADRFGLWDKRHSAWGAWPPFVRYTHSLMPFLSDMMANAAAIAATSFEIILGFLLLLKWKTSVIAVLSGGLLLTFGLCMALFNYVKAPLDYSVFSASAAAFALSAIIMSNDR